MKLRYTIRLMGLILGIPQEGGWIDALGEAARFTALTDVYQKSDNEMIVVDRDNHCLRKIER